MGRRSERITGKHLETEVIALSGKDVHIVLWAGTTYYGQLIEAEKKQVRIRDKNARWYNRRNHTHLLEIKDIREIIVDKESKW